MPRYRFTYELEDDSAAVTAIEELDSDGEAFHRWDAIARSLHVQVRSLEIDRDDDGTWVRVPSSASS